MAFTHVHTCSRAKHSTLLNVSTDIYEAGANNTEYISPQQHGEIFGTIYRQYVELPVINTNSTANISITVSNLSKIIDLKVIGYDSSDNAYPIPYSGENENDGGIEVKVTKTPFRITIMNGEDINIAGGHAWVDYTKT